MRRWTFKALQNQPLMMEVTVDHMVASKVRSVGFIGFSDAYGESWLHELTAQLAAKHIELKAVERYGSKDTSVTAQVLKLVQAKPDAILIAAAGTPGALPQKTLRDALEATKDLVTSQGVMTMSPQDHVGYDKRAAVMVQIRDGRWKYVP